MKIRRIGLAGLLAALSLNVLAASGNAPAGAGTTQFDVTGTWTATVAGGRGPAQTMVFVLKQDKKKITGTVSTNGAPAVEIKNGRALKTTVFFEVTTTRTPMAMPAAPGQKPAPAAKPTPTVTKYSGMVNGDEMVLTPQGSGGGGMGGGMPMGGGGGGGGEGGDMGGGAPMGGGTGGGRMGGGMGGMGGKTTITAKRQ